MMNYKELLVKTVCEDNGYLNKWFCANLMTKLCLAVWLFNASLIRSNGFHNFYVFRINKYILIICILIMEF